MFGLDMQFVAYYATWVVTIIYFSALIPQIILNYRLKSTAGLSDIMLIIYLMAYGTEVFYVYFLDLPLSYRTMIPLGLTAVIVIVGQRLYYVPDHGSWHFKRALLFVGVLFTLLAIGGVYDYLLLGRMAGWMAMASFMIAYIPQLVRIQTKRSVHGLSILFVLMLGFACTVEFLSAIFLGLPLPSLANGLRGMIFNIIFLIQFSMFRKTIHPDEHPLLEETQLQ